MTTTFPGSPKRETETHTEWAIRQVREDERHKVLTELLGRVRSASNLIYNNAVAAKTGTETRRLNAKDEGVRLVRGYIEEDLRGLLNSNNAPAGFEGPWAG